MIVARILAFAAALSLVACSAPSAQAPAPAGGTVEGPHSASAPAGPDTPVSSPNTRPSVTAPAPPADPSDPCEAKRFQWLVGKPKLEVGTPPPNRTWRVYSTEDAVTEDYSETRMNVMWDAKTGVVLSVKCG